ncbi:unnamed protein product [Enterobius vermicularis]|uniref:Sarcoglycan zeta n=1 Tax=Enterobius vermicularis TaxID=51028 RepID=A0A0N4V3A7_ENTVE|nr:unnamed protein product [Enterobius vermicularis]
MENYPSYQRPLDEPIWGRSSYDIHHSTAPMQSSSVLTQSPCPHHTTVVQSSSKPPAESDIYRVGIYGWRKRCLYFFICTLTIVVILNLMVTVWLLRVLDISQEGMGAMKIGDDSLRIIGEAQFERPVRFNELSTSLGGTLKIESSEGVNIIARNVTAHQTASLNMKSDGTTEAICDQFEIWDNSKKKIFFANSKEVGMKLENLHILDDGGSIFEGAIQTDLVRPLSNKPLSLESPTRSLKLDAGQDIELNSAAGEIQLSSLNDITLSSKKGAIRLESNDIFISGLPKFEGRTGISHFQLCMCDNGRLFLSAQGADCRAESQICG